MNTIRSRIAPLLVVSLLIWFGVACQAEPTPIPVSNTPLVPTFPPPTLDPPTPAPGATRTRSASPVPSASPDAVIPNRPLTIAGVGTLSREITALPEFLQNAIFDSLLRVNPQNGSLLPGLAERWAISDDAKTATFTLRQNVKWHDGKPLTADDVVFTLQALSDPDIRITPAADFGPIAKVTAPDARTVRVTWREPYCAALTYLGLVKILPQHRFENESLTNVAPSDWVGTGPLKVARGDDARVELTANEQYWGGAPRVKQWVYQLYPDARTARDAVRQGNADVLVGDAGADVPQRIEYAANEFYALAMNTTRAPFDDLRVRQAIAAALDRSELARAASAQVLETGMLPAHWAYPANASASQDEAARARQLLADAGWRDADGDGTLDKDGKALEVSLWAQGDEPYSEMTAQRVRAQLDKIGVRAILKLDDRTLFLTRLFLQEYDLALAHFNIPLDPDQHYFWSSAEADPGFGLNVTAYSNAQVDAALDAGNRAARCQSAARRNAYAPIFERLAAEVPMVFLFAPTRVLSAQPRVNGLAPSSFAGAFWNLNTWGVAP